MNEALPSVWPNGPEAFTAQLLRLHEGPNMSVSYPWNPTDLYPKALGDLGVEKRHKTFIGLCSPSPPDRVLCNLGWVQFAM